MVLSPAQLNALLKGKPEHDFVIQKLVKNGRGALCRVTNPLGLTVYKKTYTESGGGRVLHLNLPKETRFWIWSFSDKCRASQCKVIHSVDRVTYAEWDGLKYTRGATVKPHHFSLKASQCEGGIHFYFSKRAAERH